MEWMGDDSAFAGGAPWDLEPLVVDELQQLAVRGGSPSDPNVFCDRLQSRIVACGLLAFAAVGVTLLLAFVSYSPAAANAATRVLRTSNVPPISGGPGRTQAGGFFTIAYVIAFCTVGAALLAEYGSCNQVQGGALQPPQNGFFNRTHATFDFSFRFSGYRL